MCEERPSPYNPQNFKTYGIVSDDHKSEVTPKDEKLNTNTNIHDYDNKKLNVEHKNKHPMKQESDSVTFSENCYIVSDELINFEAGLIDPIKGINQTLSINFDHP